MGCRWRRARAGRTVQSLDICTHGEHRSHERNEPHSRPRPRLRQHGGHHRRYAARAGPSAQRGARRQGRRASQDGVLQSAFLGQGPNRRLDDRGWRAGRHDRAGLRDRRADVGQYGDRARVRLCREGLPLHPHHARDDVDRATQDDGAARSRARPDAHGGGDQWGLEQGRRAHGRDRGRRAAHAVRKSGQPGRAPPHDRARDLERHGRQGRRADLGDRDGRIPDRLRFRAQGEEPRPPRRGARAGDEPGALGR